MGIVHLLKIFRNIGYFLYGLAGLVLCYILFILCHRFTVLEQPVHIEDGYAISQTFTVDRSETYALGVTCQRTIPFDTLNPMLMQDLAASFSVHDGQDLVADDTFPQQYGFSYSKDIFRGLGRFSAKPFHTYRVDLKFTRTLPELEATRPKVVVQMEPSQAGRAFEGAGILIILIFLLVVVGFMFTLPDYFSKRKLRRNEEARQAM